MGATDMAKTTSGVLSFGQIIVGTTSQCLRWYSLERCELYHLLTGKGYLMVFLTNVSRIFSLRCGTSRSDAKMDPSAN
ncbi:hypothetical protein AcV5_008653 [Taiwanofungus camphoratus]|nr:hypothetical protein AcV5_008653 [Antrodia cinnamomea]